MDIQQMSCPSANLCVADGEDTVGRVEHSTMYSTDPSVGSSWKSLPSAPDRASFAGDSPITCPSTNLCLAVDSPMSHGHRLAAQVFAIRNPALPGARWQLVGGGYVSHELDTWAWLSCPTASFCAELDEKPESSNGKNEGGTFWVSAHPAIPGSWHQRALPFPGGGSLVCASEQLCVAYRSVSKRVGQVSFIRDPLKNTSRWHRYTLSLPRTFTYIGSVGCVPSGGCIMIGASVHMEYASAGILVSPNMTSGPTGWTMSPEGTETQFSSVGCLRGGTCYATTNFALVHPYQPGLVISTDPFSTTRTRWRSTADNVGSAMADPSLTVCATPHVCFDAAVLPKGRRGVAQTIETLRLSH
jgi:hypothetical protein